MLGFQIASIAFGSVSAVAWCFSALVNPDVGASYWGGPPPHIARRYKMSSIANSVGALSAAVSMALQVALMWHQAI